MSPPLIQSKKGSEAVAAYYANNTARDTSLTFGVTSRDVVKAGVKHGVKKEKGGVKITDSVKVRMQELRDGGLSAVAIGKEVGFHASSVLNHTTASNNAIQPDTLRNALHTGSSKLNNARKIVKKGEELGFFVPMHLADKHNLSDL